MERGCQGDPFAEGSGSGPEFATVLQSLGFHPLSGFVSHITGEKRVDATRLVLIWSFA